MNSFIDACVERTRSVMLILAFIIIAGTYSYITIPKEKEPDIQIPIIYVSIKHEGISPEDAERLLVKPMEKELRTIEGVKEMTASAAEGSGVVTLEFNAGFDSDKALADVRAKVDVVVPELPEDSDEPIIKEVNLSLFPVLNVILTGAVPERALVEIADDLKDVIEGLPNVLEVNISGKREDSIDIIIDPMVLESYGIRSNAAAAISQGFNKLVAAGALKSDKGDYGVKVPGLIEDLDDILSIPIKVDGEAVVTLSDIANIKKTYKDPTSFARVNGQKALVLEVSKRTGTNIIETTAQVKAIVEEAKKILPNNINIFYSQDKSSQIMNMLKDLQNNVLLAIILVMIVVIYFVGFQSAALIAFSIPGAFLIGILIIDFLGLTMNIVVLFSLILSVGMLVDSAIVVTEMANRKIIEGEGYKKAYLDSAKYMKWPIITSTATTLVVFMPLLFWPGIVGQFMLYLPITLIATLSGSLLMAIVFLPVLGNVFGKVSRFDPKLVSRMRATENGDLLRLEGFTGSYCRLLKIVLNKPKTFASTIFIILLAVYIGYGVKGTGVEFFPDIEPESSQIQIRARGNLSIYQKNEIAKQVEKIAYKFKDEIKIFYSRVGANDQGGGRPVPEDTIATISLEYSDWRTRRLSKEILDDIKKETSQIEGIIVEASEEKPGPKAIKPIEIEVSAVTEKDLSIATEKIINQMIQLGGFEDIEDSRAPPAIEWKMEVDRELAARFGTDIGNIGQVIKLVTNGFRLTTYRPDDTEDEVDILVRFPEKFRNVSTLDLLKTSTDIGKVPISSFVERKAAQKTGKINRSNGKKIINIKSNVSSGYLASERALTIRNWANQNLGSSASIRFKGDEEQQAETRGFLMKAFLIALFAMTLLMVIEFNSFYDSLIIMSAVFLSTVGVLIGLLITGQPFGVVMSGVGVIALSGVVVNNNIIFIDTYHKLRSAGMDVKDALMHTGAQRLRPILLTAGTTVLGLLPMVLGMNLDFITREVNFGSPSSQWWRQLSTAIAGGLSFATILTLFFTPSLLLLGEMFLPRYVLKRREKKYREV